MLDYAEDLKTTVLAACTSLAAIPDEAAARKPGPGKWSAKEAVFKSLGVKGQGAGAALKDIEIGNDETGAPVVNVSFSPTDTSHEY